jgi:hypothetical protein
MHHDANWDKVMETEAGKFNDLSGWCSELTYRGAGNSCGERGERCGMR